MILATYRLQVSLSCRVAGWFRRRYDRLRIAIVSTWADSNGSGEQVYYHVDIDGISLEQANNVVALVTQLKERTDK